MVLRGVIRYFFKQWLKPRFFLLIKRLTSRLIFISWHITEFSINRLHFIN